MNWSILPKPAEITEERLIDAILDGLFPISSYLPAERELASQLGVTRPTLREALQRLARDGWIEIRHGRQTRVRDFWREGSLGVLGAIAQRTQHAPPDFVPNLLQIRILLAPAYTRLAVEREADEVITFTSTAQVLPDVPQAYASFDWDLHHHLSVASGNPVFTLILNGFRELYPPMACVYFQLQQARLNSQNFYSELNQAAQRKDSPKAEEITRAIMQDSLDIWNSTVIDPMPG